VESWGIVKKENIMKRILMALMVVGLLSSCEPQGTTRLKLTGGEDLLPEELKGLKVYSVAVDNGNYVKVALFNNQVNSVTYQTGKTQTTTIMLNKQTSPSRVIEVESILTENDSIIVCRKVTK
jgi:hypothetical protein